MKLARVIAGVLRRRHSAWSGCSAAPRVAAGARMPAIRSRASRSISTRIRSAACATRSATPAARSAPISRPSARKRDAAWLAKYLPNPKIDRPEEQDAAGEGEGTGSRRSDRVSADAQGQVGDDGRAIDRSAAARSRAGGACSTGCWARGRPASSAPIVFPVLRYLVPPDIPEAHDGLRQGRRRRPRSRRTARASCRSDPRRRIVVRTATGELRGVRRHVHASGVHGAVPAGPRAHLVRVPQRPLRPERQEHRRAAAAAADRVSTRTCRATRSSSRARPEAP